MFKILSSILKKKKYFIIAVSASLVMAGLSYYLMVVNIYQKSIARYALMSGLWFTVISLILSLIIALLIGAYLALFIFRRDIVRTKAAANETISGLGGVAGIVAAGCPTCGAPLLSLIGLPFGLMALPFRGLELKVLSIALLIWSISLISKNIKKNLTCEREGIKY